MLGAKKRDYERDAVVLIRTANIIRNDIYINHYTFTGSLTDEQYENKALSLLALVEMVLGGKKSKLRLKTTML